MFKSVHCYYGIWVVTTYCSKVNTRTQSDERALMFPVSFKDLNLLSYSCQRWVCIFYGLRRTIDTMLSARKTEQTWPNSVYIKLDREYLDRSDYTHHYTSENTLELVCWGGLSEYSLLILLSLLFNTVQLTQFNELSFKKFQYFN